MVGRGALGRAARLVILVGLTTTEALLLFLAIDRTVHILTRP